MVKINVLCPKCGGFVQNVTFKNGRYVGPTGKYLCRKCTIIFTIKIIPKILSKKERE